MGISLPEVPGPIGNFVPGVLHNGLLFMSGEGPLIDRETSATGVVGRDVTVDEAYKHARLTGLAMLSSVRSILGTLDRVERLVSVQVFAENGRHARAAVGMGSLPDGITVEVTAVFAVKA